MRAGRMYVRHAVADLSGALRRVTAEATRPVILRADLSPRLPIQHTAHARVLHGPENKSRAPLYYNLAGPRRVSPGWEEFPGGALV